MVDEDNQISDSSTEELNGNEDLESFDEELDGSENSEDKSNKKSYQVRIDTLSGKNKELEERVRELEAAQKEIKTPVPPTTNTSSQLNEKDQNAIAYLKTLGFTQQEAVEERIRTVEQRIMLDSEHNRLSKDYDGSDGRPRYDKAKVESYMRERGVYDPEVAYKAMNEAELIDWSIKKAEAGLKRRPYVEKPGGSGITRNTDNQITREKIQEVVNNPTPLNRAWYEKNRNKILQMQAEGQL